MTHKSLIYLMVIGAFIGGCASGPEMKWEATPEEQAVTNDHFHAEISTECVVDGCPTFRFRIKNTSDKVIRVDWEKTYYILNDQVAGRFTWPGRPQQSMTFLPDSLLPGTHLERTLAPLYNFATTGFGYKTTLTGMPEGQNGMHLTVIVDRKEITETLMVTISQEEVPE